MAVCRGTRRDGAPCTAAVGTGQRFCYHHDPTRAEERRRNAKHAATTKHSKIDGEIRDVRLMAKELVERTVSGELDLVVRKRLTEIAQLLQVYCRLAELELAVGSRPRLSEPGEYGLPEDTAEKAKGWAEREGEKEGLLAGVASMVEEHGLDAGPLKAVLGG